MNQLKSQVPYFEEHARSVRGQILTMANDINREALRLVNNQKLLNEYLSNQTVLRNLSESVIVDGAGRIKRQNPNSPLLSAFPKLTVCCWIRHAGDVLL